MNLKIASMLMRIGFFDIYTLICYKNSSLNPTIFRGGTTCLILFPWNRYPKCPARSAHFSRRDAG